LAHQFKGPEQEIGAFDKRKVKAPRTIMAVDNRASEFAIALFYAASQACGKGRRMLLLITAMYLGATVVHAQNATWLANPGSGDFDTGTAAWFIQKHTTNEPFVVFLGQGHWPMLKYFIPTLEAAVPFNESPLKFVEVKSGVGYLPEMIDLADRLSSRFYSYTVVELHPEDEDREVIDKILRQRETNLQMRISQFEQEVDRPLTIIELNYLISKGKQQGSPVLARCLPGRRDDACRGQSTELYEHIVRLWDVNTGGVCTFKDCKVKKDRDTGNIIIKKVK
jgi:hypothetical protein